VRRADPSSKFLSVLEFAAKNSANQTRHKHSRPRYHSLQAAEDNVGGFSPFTIIEFIFGDNLGVKLFNCDSDKDFEESIYHQTAGFLLQLSNCRFDAIESSLWMAMETNLHGL